MLDRQRTTTIGITTLAAGTIVAAVLLGPGRSHPGAAPPPPAPTRHAVDVVFAIDTTGSMGGLLDGAKRTVWSIANHIHDIDRQADLRVGLVAYRDLGDDYVTKDFALTSDLDAMFVELSGYEAAGGGDTPEDVDAALFDAVHKMAWRPSATKLIFIVGDAPPATRGDVPAIDVTAREAAAQQIKINTIRCGEDPDTAAAWQRIASIGRGEFSTVQEDGGVQQIATPYDDELARLGARIDATRTVYGGAEIHAEYTRKMAVAAAAPAPVVADRAAYNAMAIGSGEAAKDDLTAQAAEGHVDLDGISRDDLPADLRALPEAQLAQELQRRAAERAVAQKKIEEIARQREEYLSAHDAKAGGFDKAVDATLEHELK